MESILASCIVAGSIVGSSIFIGRKIRQMNEAMFFALLKGSLISNFSRFSQLDETSIAVIDQHAYYVQNGTLWIADFFDNDMVMQSARPIDLVNADNLLLREAMMAVDVLNNVVNSQNEEDGEEED